MITFKNFLNESINDKGLFKCIFVIGLPGAGKSYTISKLTGRIAPRIVNTDRASEFLSSKFGLKINAETWGAFQDKSTKLTKASLANYIDGMLPLFVDGTSNDISNLLHRIGILESLGYDVGIVYIKSDFEVAKSRVEKREKEIGRSVDLDFMQSVHDKIDSNVEYLKSKISFFKTLNNVDEIDNEALIKLYKSTQSFFNAPLENPIGIRTLDKLKQEKQSYLVPSVLNKEVLSKKIDGWYKN